MPRWFVTASAIVLGTPLLIGTTVVATTVALNIDQRSRDGQSRQRSIEMADHPYVGRWVTDDGQIRHELLPNGRYDEARGTRESAYQGRYEVSGNHIDYWDDTGFTADGTFVNLNEPHHGGMMRFGRPAQCTAGRQAGEKRRRPLCPRFARHDHFGGIAINLGEVVDRPIE